MHLPFVYVNIAAKVNDLVFIFSKHISVVLNNKCLVLSGKYIGSSWVFRLSETSKTNAYGIFYLHVQ